MKRKVLLWQNVKYLKLGEHRHVFVNLNIGTSLSAFNKTSFFSSENSVLCCSVIYKESVGITVLVLNFRVASLVECALLLRGVWQYSSCHLGEDTNGVWVFS